MPNRTNDIFLGEGPIRNINIQMKLSINFVTANLGQVIEILIKKQIMKE